MILPYWSRLVGEAIPKQPRGRGVDPEISGCGQKFGPPETDPFPESGRSVGVSTLRAGAVG